MELLNSIDANYSTSGVTLEDQRISYLTIISAVIYCSNPNSGISNVFVTISYGDVEESTVTAQTDGRWNHTFGIRRSKVAAKQVLLKLSEYCPEGENVVIGQVTIPEAHLDRLINQERSLGFESVARKSTPAPAVLAPFFRLTKSSIRIRFGLNSPNQEEIFAISSESSNLATPSLSQAGSSTTNFQGSSSISPPLPAPQSNPPPLPPRPYQTTSLPITSIASTSNGLPQLGSAIPPNSASHVDNILLQFLSETSTNNTPAESNSDLIQFAETPLVITPSNIRSIATVKPPPRDPQLPKNPNNTPLREEAHSQGFFIGMLNKLPSNTTVLDVKYQDLKYSPHNRLDEFNGWYQTLEDVGHASFLMANPSMLQDYVYLYVPGLYSGRSMSGAKAELLEYGNVKTKHHERVEQLRKLGMDARVVSVPNDGLVVDNSGLVAKCIRAVYHQTKKPVVLIGYSKGGVDSAAALSMNPDLVPIIRCFITLCSPLQGSHIATDIEKSSSIQHVINVAVHRLLSAQPTAINELTMRKRKAFLAEHPLDPTVPALSLACAVTFADHSEFYTTYRYIKSTYLKENDGLVACCDAIYPDAQFILLTETDHQCAKGNNRFYRNPVSFIIAVIAVALDTTVQKWNNAIDNVSNNNEPPVFTMPNEPFAP